MSHQEYPKMLYKGGVAPESASDGKEPVTEIVAGIEEEKELNEEGYYAAGAGPRKRTSAPAKKKR